MIGISSVRRGKCEPVDDDICTYATWTEACNSEYLTGKASQGWACQGCYLRIGHSVEDMLRRVSQWFARIFLSLSMLILACRERQQLCFVDCFSMVSIATTRAILTGTSLQLSTTGGSWLATQWIWWVYHWSAHDGTSAINATRKYGSDGISEVELHASSFAERWY